MRSNQDLGLFCELISEILVGFLGGGRPFRNALKRVSAWEGEVNGTS